MESAGDILKRQGLTSSRTVSGDPLVEKINCQNCRDTGWVYHNVPVGHEDFGKVFPCNCKREQTTREQAQVYLKYCQLPARTEDMTFENFNTGPNSDLKEAKSAAIHLAKGNILWLTLLSEVGRGKTHLAIAVCRYWLSRGKAARYTFVPLLLKELRDGFELKDEHSYRQAFDRLCTVPLLVLDDLGVEAPTVWGQEQLQTIVHYRGIWGLPLVVTSNKEIDKLVGDKEGRIASRLQRETWCQVLVIDAPEHKEV